MATINITVVSGFHRVSPGGEKLEIPHLEGYQTWQTQPLGLIIMWLRQALREPLIQVCTEHIISNSTLIKKGNLVTIWSPSFNPVISANWVVPNDRIRCQSTQYWSEPVQGPEVMKSVSCPKVAAIHAANSSLTGHDSRHLLNIPAYKKLLCCKGRASSRRLVVCLLVGWGFCLNTFCEKVTFTRVP